MRLLFHTGTLLSLLALAILLECSPQPSLPSSLHCLSRLSFDNEALKSEDYLRIDEYLDLESRHASISIYNVRDDSTEINYKKFTSSELADRMVIRFIPSEKNCQAQLMGHSQIAELRRLSLYLYKLKEIPEEFVDVPIGPSLLLFAIQASMDQFRYVKTIQADSPGVAQLNVYTREIVSDPLGSIFGSFYIELHTSSQGQRRGLKPGNSLESAMVDGARLDVKLVSASLVEDKRRRGTRPNDSADSTGLDCGHDGETPCSTSIDASSKLFLFKVDFDVVELFQTGSLIGRQLDELERQTFQFSREPFLQPVGIGCWSLFANQKWRSSLIEKSKSTGGLSFSALYVTSAGLKGVSYVAYDEPTNMLRLDREGRKSVYDITQGKSYHVGEFSDSSGLGDSLLASELATEKCIVLEISDLIKLDRSVMIQLTGLGSTDAHYLGPRTIEHEQYKVYEISLTEPQMMPILLQTKLHTANKEFDLTYFITYYVQADDRLRFMELYSFEAPLKKRQLINRLEFVEFSWSLDVEPLDDSQSGANSDSSLRLFQVDVCHHNRATQSSLVVALNSDESEANLDRVAEGLRYQKLEVTGAIQRVLANSLRVSPVNVVDLKLNLDSVARDGRLLASGRVVDLKDGMSKLTNLGATYLIDDGHTLEFYQQRFSLEDCLLDSLEYPKANKFAFCPQLARCLILSADYEDHELLAEKLATRRDMCHVYSLMYSTTETRAGSASYMAEINQRSLDSQQFEFRFMHEYNLHDSEMPSYTFKAKFELKDLVRLDPIGAQLLGRGDRMDAAKRVGLLSGLRYTTMDEEPASHNSNARVAMSSELERGKGKAELFVHCQLSCQMDEFCGSFSVCFRGKKGAQLRSECILSTVRLTGERVEKLLEAADRVREGQDGFLVNISNEFASQSLQMRRDDDCSLHPRDFISDYELIRSTETVHNKHKGQAGTLDSLRSLPEMTFADCAGLSYEKTFGIEFVHQTNFTYCQLNSLCLILGDETIEKQLELADGPCRSYRRNAARFYSSFRATHMRVADIRASLSADESLIKDMTNQQDVEESASPRLATTFWGVSEADCARDCSLHKSECLAFDSCRNDGKILCILYAVRSPLSPRGAYLPLLEREQKLQSNDSVTLFGSRICDHFYLKRVYFGVRLKNLLARSKPDGAAEFFPDDLKKLEDKVEASSERLNQEDLLAVSDLETIVENFRRERPPRTEARARHGALIRGYELAIGLIAGCLVTAYKQQLSELMSSVYLRSMARS